MSTEKTTAERMADIEAALDARPPTDEIEVKTDDVEETDEIGSEDVEETETKGDVLPDEDVDADDVELKEGDEDDEEDVDAEADADEVDAEAGGGDADEDADEEADAEEIVDSVDDVVTEPEDGTTEDEQEAAGIDEDDEEDEEPVEDEGADGNDDETSDEIEEAVEDEKADSILASLTLPDEEDDVDTKDAEEDLTEDEDEVEEKDDESDDEIVVKVDDLDEDEGSEEEITEEKDDEGPLVINKDNGEFLCGAQRKAVTSHCDFCVGGCAPEGNLPGLADIEAQVKDAHGVVEVVNSGYSPSDDLFLIDGVKTDGSAWEFYVTGEGIELGNMRIDPDSLDSKSAETDIISRDEAAAIAVMELPGVVHGVDPDAFNGLDAYVVEIDGDDGKSYDAYVSLEGKMLGYDTWDVEDDEDPEIKELEAELELKRLYSRERREEMAEEGLALPDGSFPIGDDADLKNAVTAYGRASDQAKAKAHIIKRARDLGRTDLLPEAWGFTEEEEKGSDEIEDVEVKDDTVETEEATPEVTEEEEPVVEEKSDLIDDEAMADLRAAIEEFRTDID